MAKNLCELCGAEADLHCAADSAFLCNSCDGKIHGSNFLFSRHLRRIICPNCKSLTGDFVSGPLSPWPPTTTTCCSRSCSSSSSSASSCCSSLDRVSTSDLRKKKKNKTRVVRERRVKAVVAEGIFVKWCDELGLNGDLRNAVVSLASLVLDMEEPREATTKKVVLAGAFWFGVKRSSRKMKMMTWPSLKKVEDVTGVASGMIRAVESKLAREMMMRIRRWRVDSEEGWAENDNV